MNIQTQSINTKALQTRKATAQTGTVSATTTASESFQQSAPQLNAAPTLAEMKAFFEPPKSDLKMSRLPDIPSPARSSFGTARIDSKVYIVGGHQGREHTYPPESFLDNLQVFDLESKEWSTLAPRPVKAHGYSVVSDGPHLYAFGGFTYSGEHKPKWKSIPDVHRYDTRSDSWEKVGELAEPRSSNAAVQVGRKVYMVGGWDSTPKSEGDLEGKFHQTVEVLDLDSGKIETAPYEIPKRRAFTAFEKDGEVIMLGGLGEGATHFELIDRVTALNPETGESRELPKLPFPTFAPGAGVIGDTMYLFGGFVATGGGEYNYVDTIYKLEPGASRWEDAGVLLSENKGFPMVLNLDDNSLGILGGHSYDNGDEPVSTFEVLTGKSEKE